MPAPQAHVNKEGFPSLLRPEEVCQFLNIGRRTLWRWIAAGIVPEPIRYNARVVRWRREVIQALADNPSR